MTSLEIQLKKTAKETQVVGDRGFYLGIRESGERRKKCLFGGVHTVIPKTIM